MLSMSGAAPPPLSHQMAGLMQPPTFNTLGRNSKVLTACSASTYCLLELPLSFTLGPYIHTHSEVLRTYIICPCLIVIICMFVSMVSHPTLFLWGLWTLWCVLQWYKPGYFSQYSYWSRAGWLGFDFLMGQIFFSVPPHPDQLFGLFCVWSSVWSGFFFRRAKQQCCEANYLETYSAVKVIILTHDVTSYCVDYNLLSWDAV